MPTTPGTFAEMVDTAATRLGLRDNQLSAAVGLMPGNRVFEPRQVGRLRAGEQVHHHPDVVRRLIVVLELDPYEAWIKSGTIPPELTADHLRQLDLFGTRNHLATA